MNNKIGVLVSKGYGAGWSTWGDKQSCLDKELVAAFEAELPDKEIIKIAEKNWPLMYHGGLLKCEVHYVDEGTVFTIDEFEGYETLSIFYDDDILVAK